MVSATEMREIIFFIYFVRNILFVPKICCHKKLLQKFCVQFFCITYQGYLIGKDNVLIDLLVHISSSIQVQYPYIVFSSIKFKIMLLKYAKYRNILSSFRKTRCEQIIVFHEFFQ